MSTWTLTCWSFRGCVNSWRSSAFAAASLVLFSGLPCFAWEKKLNDCCCLPCANHGVLWICGFSSTVWEERRLVPSKFYGRTGLVDAVTCLSVLPVAAASKLVDAETMKTPFRSDGRSFIDIFSFRTRLRAGDEACARLPLEIAVVGFSSSRSSPLPSPRHPLGVETPAADGIDAGVSDHFDPHIESGVFYTTPRLNFLST